MKKILLTSLTVASALMAVETKGQGWTSSGSDLVTTPATNNVGIGDNTPGDKLSINGNMSFTPGLSARTIYGKSDDYLNIYSKNDFADGSGILLGANGSTGYDGLIRMVSGGNAGATTALDLLQYNGGAYNRLFHIRKDGDVFVSNTIGFTPVYNAVIHGNSTKYFDLYANNDFSNGAAMVLGSNGTPGYDGSIKFVSGGGVSTATAMHLLQYNGGAYNMLFHVSKNGDFNMSSKLAFNPAHNSVIQGNSTKYFDLYANDDFSNGAGMVLGANGVPSFDGVIRFVSGGNSSSDPAMQLHQYNGGALDHLFYVRKDGKMVIGDVTPTSGVDDYNLYVENGILTEKVKVAIYGTGQWSDFVFADDYKLMPLSQVEEFIKDNKHLPEIPSATEVVKDGIDLAVMDAKLLQKIEELTLHVIQQQKKIEELEKKLDR